MSQPGRPKGDFRQAPPEAAPVSAGRRQSARAPRAVTGALRSRRRPALGAPAGLPALPWPPQPPWPAPPPAADSAPQPLPPAEVAAALPAAESFGAFTIGDWALALPLRALREVLPAQALLPLASPARCVLGGVSMRGTTVPVIDLRCALGRCPAPQPLADAGCVLVVVHGGALLGLAADGVQGVFEAPPAACAPMQARAAGPADDPLASLLAGSLRGPHDAPPLQLLSPEALARLPQVPWVRDPEPDRVQATADDAKAPCEDSVTLLLLRCGALPLAIDALAVQATLPAVLPMPSPLARGHCRGVLTHAGATIAAVDLAALVGLGQPGSVVAQQSVVIQLGSGRVALLVDDVLEVVRVPAGALLQVPAHALPVPALVCGGLPLEALPPPLARACGTQAHLFLRLDVQGLQAHPDLLGLAASQLPAAGARPAGQPPLPGGAAPAPADGASAEAAGAARTRCGVITFALAGETASPADQVQEILPYQHEAAVFRGTGALLGLVVHRGRSIPVLCLSALHGLPSPQASPAVRVLVIEVDGAPLGFAVPQLLSIEQGERRHAQAGPASRGGPLDTRLLVRVGEGAQERLLPLLDLHALARRHMAQAAAA